MRTPEEEPINDMMSIPTQSSNDQQKQKREPSNDMMSTPVRFHQTQNKQSHDVDSNAIIKRSAEEAT
jgi:hypothetical protein